MHKMDKLVWLHPRHVLFLLSLYVPLALIFAVLIFFGVSIALIHGGWGVFSFITGIITGMIFGGAGMMALRGRSHVWKRFEYCLSLCSA
jgi:hypothetical protein